MTRLKPIKYPLLILAVLAALTAAGLGLKAVAFEPVQDFVMGVSAYEDGNYPEAARHFQQAVQEGLNNGKLYYNLAGAYFKLGDLGRAVLYYERAQKLIPGDPDLRFNLDYVRTKLKDREETNDPVILRVLFFWRNFLTEKTIQSMTMAFNLIFWLFLVFRLFWRKRIINILCALSLGLTILTAPTALYLIYEHQYQQAGVVLPESLTIRSGLSEEATTLFVLHAGTKFIVEDEKNGYYRIRFSRDKIGWAPKQDIGLI